MMKLFSPRLRPGKCGLRVSHGLGVQPDAATQTARAPVYGRFLQHVSSPQLLEGQTEGQTQEGRTCCWDEQGYLVLGRDGKLMPSKKKV